MVSLVNAHQLQAEATVSFANIAETSEDLAADMCSDRLFNHWKTMISSDRVNVAFPASGLLSKLSKYDETLSGRTLLRGSLCSGGES